MTAAYVEIFQHYFAVVRYQEDEKYALLSQGTGYLKNLQQMWRNSKQEKFSNYLIPKESYGSFKSYIFLINSFKFIHCFLPKQSKRSFSFTCNLLFKNKKKTIRPSSVKIWRTQFPYDKSAHFSSYWDLMTTKNC